MSITWVVSSNGVLAKDKGGVNERTELPSNLHELEGLVDSLGPSLTSLLELSVSGKDTPGS